MNKLTSVQDARNLHTALILSTTIADAIDFDQFSESKFAVKVKVENIIALDNLSGYEIKVLGKASTKSLINKNDVIELQMEFEVVEDWELEHDIYPILKTFGYQQPTDMRFKKTA